MRWERADAIALGTFIRNAPDWDVYPEIEPWMLVPEFLRDEAKDAFVYATDHGSVALVFSSGDPNTGKFEKPMVWIGRSL